MITVNGQSREATGQTSVADLVTEVVGQGQTRGVAVAVNGEVLPRTAWASTPVTEGDRVEVLTATQGG